MLQRKPNKKIIQEQVKMDETYIKKAQNSLIEIKQRQSTNFSERKLQFIDDFQQENQEKKQVSVQKQPDVKLKKSRAEWTQRRYQLAKRYFEMYSSPESKTNLIEIANKLNISLHALTKAWKLYQEDKQMTSIRQEINMRAHSISYNADFYISRIEKIILKNGTLSCLAIAKLLNEQFNLEGIPLDLARMSQGKVQLFLKQAGYIFQKIEEDSIDNINTSEKIDKREQFCKHYEALLKANFELFYFQEEKVIFNRKRNFGWAKIGEKVILPSKKPQKKGIIVSCILNPQGVLGWNVSFQSVSTQYYSRLLERLEQNGGNFNQKSRKLIVVDKKSLQNGEIFTQFLDNLNFDIVNLPYKTVMPNPLDKWMTMTKHYIKQSKYTHVEGFQKKVFEQMAGLNSSEAHSSLKTFKKMVLRCLKRQII